VSDFERHAKDRLNRAARDYYFSGANGMLTLNATRAAFDRIKLKRAAEVDVSKFEGMQTSVLGVDVYSPIMIASTAFHRMAHPDGEIATARAAEAFYHTAFTLSNWANTANEEVGKAAPNCLKMFQIYLSKREEVNRDLWKRVKESGFTALLLTTDT
jgi:isopentenyl diphosphate isomerase/L-lactate dehydrogenase-like FMN-dependent dehydrogenase